MEVIWKYEELENDNINSSSNICNCKSLKDWTIGGICHLKDVVYQTTIFPKENIKDKKKKIYIGISSIS